MDYENPMKPRHLPKITLFLALAATLLGGPASAKEYLIEAVLFETLAGRDASTGGLYYPRQSGGLRLGSEQAIAESFVNVEQGLTLSENAASIAASGRYRLLRHLAWRQPGLDSDSAKAVRINLGEPSTVYIPDDASNYDDFIPASVQPEADRTTEVRTTTVNGSIKVRLGRFLHIDCQLVFTDTDTQQSFRLLQSRKMRSGELHYIDNPRFGVLTRITPLPEAESTSN